MRKTRAVAVTHILLQCAVVCVLLASCSWFSSSGTNGEEEPVTVSPTKTSSLEIGWVRDVDQRRPASASGYSLPAVAADDILICGEDKRVHIFNLHGSEQARIALEGPCESGALTLANGLVSLVDTDGMMYGIDPGKASILWKHRLSSTVLGTPEAVDGDFLVQTADNKVYRFSAEGKEIWSYSGSVEGLTIHAGSSPAVSGGDVFAVFANGDVVALRGEGGDLLWRQQLYLSNEATAFSEIRAPLAAPVVTGEMLIISFFQGDMFALSTKDGHQLWSRPISLKGVPLVSGTILYAASSDGSVFALDAASGQTIWKQKVSNAELIGPVLWKNHLVAGDSRGRIIVLDRQGNLVRELTVAGRIDRSPVAFQGGILVRNDLGSLYLLH